MGHGHVTPNEDGSKARCGGPSFCKECKKEYMGIPKNLRGEIIKLSLHTYEGKQSWSSVSPHVLNSDQERRIAEVYKYASKAIQAIIHEPKVFEDLAELSEEARVFLSEVGSIVPSHLEKSEQIFPEILLFMSDGPGKNQFDMSMTRQGLLLKLKADSHSI